LGATLFHLLAGRPPFSGSSPLILLSQHTREAPPALLQLRPELSEGLCRLVERMLAKAPDDRPADADALLRELERLLSGEPVDIAVRPRLPACDPANLLRYDFTWDLAASARQLWPYVSNTERLNRAAGIPAVQFTTQTPPEADAGAEGKTIEPPVRRFGRLRKLGITAAWEEYPFEWIEAKRMGGLREYSQGPFKWLVSVVELTPRAGGGTTLTHQ